MTKLYHINELIRPDRISRIYVLFITLISYSIFTLVYRITFLTPSIEYFPQKLTQLWTRKYFCLNVSMLCYINVIHAIYHARNVQSNFSILFSYFKFFSILNELFLFKLSFSSLTLLSHYITLYLCQNEKASER